MSIRLPSSSFHSLCLSVSASFKTCFLIFLLFSDIDVDVGVVARVGRTKNQQYRRRHESRKSLHEKKKDRSGNSSDASQKKSSSKSQRMESDELNLDQATTTWRSCDDRMWRTQNFELKLIFKSSVNFEPAPASAMTIEKTFELGLDISSDKLNEGGPRKDGDIAQIVFVCLLVLVIFAVCVQCCRFSKTISFIKHVFSTLGGKISWKKIDVTVAQSISNQKKFQH